MAWVLARSPPLPGSEVMVPHQAPSHTVWKMRRRWASQAAWKGAGTWALASQKTSTVGCIAQTNATEESPCASVRRSSQRGRVDWRTLSQMPPWSTGTPARGNPASRSCAKSAATSVPPLLPLTALRGEAGGQFADVFEDDTGIHGARLLVREEDWALHLRAGLQLRPHAPTQTREETVGARPFVSRIGPQPNVDTGGKFTPAAFYSRRPVSLHRHQPSCSGVLEASLKRIHTMIQRVSRDPVAVNGLKSVERHAAVPCQHGLT